MKKDEDEGRSVTDLVEMLGYIVRESLTLGLASLISLELSSGQPIDRITPRRAVSD